MKTVAAGEFKAKCLQIMDEVASGREPVLITKRGKPVARLVPIDPVYSILGCMAGRMEIDTSFGCPNVLNRDRRGIGTLQK